MKGRKNCFAGCCICVFCYLFVLLLVIFLTIFLIVPLIFKYSPNIQKSIIFPTYLIDHKNYSDVESFNIQGVNNFYINVNEAENISLGVWQILPNSVLSEFIKNENYDYNLILQNETHNILIYLHGNGADRTDFIPLYRILRKYFHIFAVDYRGYGDSSKGEMTETGLVNDIVQFYKWVRNQTNSNIFIWGHSLGTGVGTHATANLYLEKYNTSGLILEAPFSSVTDVIDLNPIIKIFSWLPWYRMTVINPIIDNDLDFASKNYIDQINSPIMILHAKGDTIIPYELATMLYNIAVSNRNYTYQGNVTYHLFGEERNLDHMDIYTAHELPNYINEFITESLKFANRTNEEYT